MSESTSEQVGHALITPSNFETKFTDADRAMLMVTHRMVSELHEMLANVSTQLAPMLDGIKSGPLGGMLGLLIGGGFDTTTSLTAKSLDWLSNNPGERARLAADLPGLINSATEEFLRFFTPAPGDGRTVTTDCVYAGQQLKEGDRLWLSWAMANRDPEVFPDPNTIHLDRTNNRHSAFGLGVHRCIGSNVARSIYKTMLTQVLDRMPDFVCDSDSAVHYDTVGVINGMKHLSATFTPGPRLGEGLEATIAKWQHKCDTEGLAEPIARSDG